MRELPQAQEPPRVGASQPRVEQEDALLELWLELGRRVWLRPVVALPAQLVRLRELPAEATADAKLPSPRLLSRRVRIPRRFRRPRRPSGGA